MRLYHGTNLDIHTIDLEKCRPYKDFGRGFYLTEFKDQAIKMAKRVSRIYGGTPVVNVYDLSEGYRDNCDLKVRAFDNGPDKDWARFVMNNRNRDFTDTESSDCNLDLKYDIVIGPIANDDMAMLFRQFQYGLIPYDTLVSGLTYREVTNQYSFHTEKSIQLLRKVGTL